MHITHSTRKQASFLAHSCEPKESLLDFGVLMGFQGGQMSWAESSWIKIQVFLPRAHFCLTPRPALYSQKQLLDQCLMVDCLAVISSYALREVKFVVI